MDIYHKKPQLTNQKKTQQKTTSPLRVVLQLSKPHTKAHPEMRTPLQKALYTNTSRSCLDLDINYLLIYVISALNKFIFSSQRYETEVWQGRQTF